MLIRVLLIAVCSVFGIGSTVLLFVISEDIMTKANTFIRRFPPHPVEYLKQTDLRLNSYYIAGYGNGKIYLGNYTSPFRVLEIDTTLTTRREHKLDLNFQGTMKAPKLVVDGSLFYIADGTMPYLAIGNTQDWKGKAILNEKPYFTIAVKTNDGTFAFRGISSANNENVIGKTEADTIQLAPELLQKQSGGDGIFDTDGHLLYSKTLNRIIYVYAYRNQFIVANPDLTLDYKGKTIDTVQTANLKITKRTDGASVMAAPAMVVNGGAVVLEKLLFVDGRLRGRYEQEDVWRRSTTFDVYDLSNNEYLMSFYISALGRHKPHSYYAIRNRFFAVINDQLVVYEIKGDLKKQLSQMPVDVSGVR